MLKCPRCASLLPDGSMSCPKCGARFRRTANPQRQTGTPSQSPPLASPPKTTVKKKNSAVPVLLVVLVCIVGVIGVFLFSSGNDKIQIERVFKQYIDSQNEFDIDTYYSTLTEDTKYYVQLTQFIRFGSVLLEKEDFLQYVVDPEIPIHGNLTDLVISGNKATATAIITHIVAGDIIENEHPAAFKKEKGRWKIDNEEEFIAKRGYGFDSYAFEMIKFHVDLMVVYGDGQETDKVLIIQEYADEYGMDAVRPYIKTGTLPPDFEAYLDREIAYYEELYGYDEYDGSHDTDFYYADDQESYEIYDEEPEPYYEPFAFTDEEIALKRHDNDIYYDFLAESALGDEIVLSGIIQIEHWYHGGQGQWLEAPILQLDKPIKTITLASFDGDYTYEQVKEVFLLGLPEHYQQPGYHVVLKGVPSAGGGTIYYRRAVSVDVIECYSSNSGYVQ